MKASNRIIVNTLAQYTRTIINLVLSLYSARLVLNILGVDDYGIFALIGGVVSMLSFFTNSLVGSTQRFLSVYQGKGILDDLRRVFASSVLLHILLGFIVLIILEAITPFLFDGFLNIPPNKISAATIVYQQVVVMVYITFISAPYKALLVSRENIVYTSIIDVANGVLKVILVLILPFVPASKLVAYGWIILSISVFEFFAYSLYSHRHYPECVIPKFAHFSRSYIKELMSFTGWITYSTLCIAIRNQGLAIILNRIKGTAINAAYGIGMQISGMVSFVSTSLSNAIAPQLMASEGNSDRHKMLFLAEMNSKFSFLLLAMVGIPTMFEMQTLLQIWLGNVPTYTMLFGCMFLSMMIIDMLTTGLATANNSVGHIGWYTFINYSPKLLVIPICLIAIEYDNHIEVICTTMVALEAICMLMRLPQSKRIDGFSISTYSRNVFAKVYIPTILSIIICYGLHYSIESEWRIIASYLLSVPIFCIAAYKFSLGDIEKQKVDNILNKIKSKLANTH